MNKASRDLGADKLAVGHNLDDEIQTFIMNVVHAHLTNIARSGVSTEVLKREKLVSRIKPLFFNEDRENAVYVFLKGFYPPIVECPYAPLSSRYEYRRFVNELEAKSRGNKFRILKSMLLLRKTLMDRARTYSPRPCEICGEPTSRRICKACEIREKISAARASRHG